MPWPASGTEGQVSVGSFHDRRESRIPSVAEDEARVAVVGNDHCIFGWLKLTGGGEALAHIDGLAVGGMAAEFPKVDIGRVDDIIGAAGIPVELPRDGADKECNRTIWLRSRLPAIRE